MIHNHEVRSSILRPATRKRTAEKSAVFFVACKDEVRPYRAGDHESWLSMGYSPVFLGNKRLRSKSGLEGGTEWRLKHPATRYKNITEDSVMFFCMPGLQSVKAEVSRP